MKLINDRPSHWYRRDGIPVHEVPRKDGTGMKATTLKEARELDLLPSVTNILGVLDRPALTNWKIEQGILSALTLPKLPDETADAFAHRVVQDMEAQVSAAADFGSRLHAAIADQLMFNAPESEDPELLPYLKYFMEWAKSEVEQVHGVELTIVCLEYGYAGRLDLICDLREIGRAVVDFKTQKVRRGGAAFYDEWPLQLAAYAFGSFVDCRLPSALVSVVINSAEPGPVSVRQWPEPHRHFELFKAAFELWKYQKGFDPLTNCHETTESPKAKMEERRTDRAGNRSGPQ